ncbi:DUF6542 domain-containing protein [Microbispora sp. H11081]|uniref:DUF6542 domain-containing protein n=1 Tax=Microbispora sp. H11081 TaxID=2729107 RepID=UPI0014759721|nr:DUF6542 domain-containing protein [Microbispora sp. H11081]
MTGTGRAGLRLTARGAIVMLFVITVVGMPFLPGPAFVAGCLAAALLVRPRDLLPLVVTPPLVFFTAALMVELVRALGSGSALKAFGLGMFTALSSGAPWLFLGSALALGAAWFRGLPANVKELRGAPAPAPAHASRSRRGGGFDPEPEGYFEPRVYGRAADE